MGIDINKSVRKRLQELMVTEKQGRLSEYDQGRKDELTHMIPRFNRLAKETGRMIAYVEDLPTAESIGQRINEGPPSIEAEGK